MHPHSDDGVHGHVLFTQRVGITTENHVTLEIKNGGFLSKFIDSGKTFFDISVYTGQICMGFEAVALTKRKQHVHL